MARLATLVAALALTMVAPAALADDPRVRIRTDLGDMVLALHADRAPSTVANFLDYVHRYFYDGVIFHRVVAGFVIQSGGHTFDLSAKEAGDPVVNESANGLKNLRGTIAMARHQDPDSARSQFYINLDDNPNLDPDGDKAGYTVFGTVVEGMEVADAIGAVAVRPVGSFQHLPVETVQILSIRVIDNPAGASRGDSP